MKIENNNNQNLLNPKLEGKYQGFTQIPNTICRTAFISPYAKSILMSLASLYKCYPSYKWISGATGIKSQTTIAKCLAELESTGFIERIRRPDKMSNGYKINLRALDQWLGSSPSGAVVDTPKDEETTSLSEGVVVHEVDANNTFIKILDESDSSAVNRPLTAEEIERGFGQILETPSLSI